MLAKHINIFSGFQSDLLWPFCLPVIQSHLKFIKDSIILEYAPNTNWIRCCDTVQTEVLLFPPEIDICTHRNHAIDVKKSCCLMNIVLKRSCCLVNILII